MNGGTGGIDGLVITVSLLYNMDYAGNEVDCVRGALGSSLIIWMEE